MLEAERCNFSVILGPNTATMPVTTRLLQYTVKKDYMNKFPQKKTTHIQSIRDWEAHDAWSQVVSSNDGKQSSEHYDNVSNELQSHGQPAETQSSSRVHCCIYWHV